MKYLITLLCTLFLAPYLYAITLTTMTQDLEPKWILKDNNTITGLSADILYAIEKHSNGEITFEWENRLFPIKRLLKTLKENKIDLAMSMAYSKKRAKEFQYSVPLYNVNYLMAKRKADSINVTSFDEVTKLGRDGVVLSVFGGNMEQVLRAQKDLQIYTRNKPTTEILHDLANGNGRLFYYYDYGLSRAIKKAKLEQKLTILPSVFFQDAHHIIYTKHVPKEVVKKIDAIILRMQENGHMQAIYDKYTK